MPQPMINLIGQRFGRLVVKSVAGRCFGYVAWLCACDCGNQKVIPSSSLRRGQTRSCGCLCSEVATAMRTTHGYSRSPEYRTWDAMRRRCRDPKNNRYALYGARGIRVHPDWDGSEGFPAFLAEVGLKPEPKRKYTLERIDSNGNYEPGNVRWATYSEQNSNRRPYKRRRLAK